VLLADRHHGLSEGVRGLLETEFSVVVMVADETSLIEGARRMHPTLAVADLSLARGESLRWIATLHADNPSLKVVVLSVHDEPSACRSAMAAGVNGFVLKRDIARELLQAVAAALEGKRYVSAGVRDRLSPADRAMLETSTP
jgi:DNA-binding NarL/FixJ family response regulator